MELDVEGQLRAVERSVAFSEVDGKAAGAVVLRRSFETTVEDLWGAITEAERIAQWFLPVSGDLEEGGSYALAGNANGTITACERLSHYELTWEFAGDVSWVGVRVSEAGDGRAGLELTHASILSGHWDTFGPGAAGVGWEIGLLGLAMYLELPDEPKIDEAAFAASPDGKAFVSGSSEAWGEAWMAAGAEREPARAAAERTTAFYTGEEIESD